MLLPVITHTLQENGNKTDVRWMALTNTTGQGLLIRGYNPLLFFCFKTHRLEGRIIR